MKFKAGPCPPGIRLRKATPLQEQAIPAVAALKAAGRAVCARELALALGWKWDAAERVLLSLEVRGLA